ncbi:phosphatidylserine decarboxylase [Pseudoduganella sp. FT26W]|uniref:Phosphatidylserine decarboxylase n=2 Tax=Duganella aquatilis TaxID=2666082 RepID=A0A844D662_9BURK|nr:phosphatidylserine decarboxylase [Duganella aquatilis]
MRLLGVYAQAHPAPLLPPVAALAQHVAADAELSALVVTMFDELPSTPPCDCDPTGRPQARSFAQALQMINAALGRPPEFNQTGITGLPINAIVNWLMPTASGHKFFLDADVNRCLKAILDHWGRFLTSAASLPALSNDPHKGWFGADAMQHMSGFDEEFECDPALPYRGYRSWDEFFTRRFRPGQRPVEAPHDDAVIVNACESSPYRLARGVTLQDRFWIKAQPYALGRMLAGDELAGRFDGGTVYQAFLSSFSYHRWHSPVSGRIVKAYVVEGSYYSSCIEEGLDPSAPRQSQAYITQVASRALVFIEADRPGIGLMCFMAVGMAEVSACEITVAEGERVEKGQQIGMFHFGGSTHCLIFRPETKLDFDLRGQRPGLDSQKIKLCERIATVKD